MSSLPFSPKTTKKSNKILVKRGIGVTCLRDCDSPPDDSNVKRRRAAAAGLRGAAAAASHDDIVLARAALSAINGGFLRSTLGSSTGQQRARRGQSAIATALRN